MSQAEDGATSARTHPGEPYLDEPRLGVESVAPEEEIATTTAPEEKRRRLGVLKTYKLYIGGAFPRTESGRYDKLLGPDGAPLANICRGSRKDFRNAVVEARAAQSGWAARSAYNRGQILYRIAEMLEGRGPEFETELRSMGAAAEDARTEVEATVDRLVYYAGWADKYQQVFSSVNPVSSSHFNFSILEPTGVVAVVAPEDSGLLGLVSTLAPAITGGNTCVVLASGRFPLCAVTLAEVLHSSDVPAGVVNLLTGRREELRDHFASHMDVNALMWSRSCARGAGDSSEADVEAIHRIGAENLKRIRVETRATTQEWMQPGAQSPYRIRELQEIKTTWHPIGT